MSNLSVNLRLRPIRFAYLVRPDDQKHALDAFHINACLWGGKCNPIIPFFRQLPKWWDKKGHRFENPKQILTGYIDFFEPDFIVQAEKRMTDSLGFDPKRVLRFLDILERDRDRNRDGFGQSVNDVYSYLYSKEFQFTMRHKPTIMDVRAEDESFNAFMACV